MSHDNNRVELTGFLGRDPESTTTPSGAVVTKFSVATDNGYFDQTSQKWIEQDSDWHNIVAWRKKGERAMAELRKGDKVFVVGRLCSRQYEHKTAKNDKGEPLKLTAVEVQLERFERLVHEKKGNGAPPHTDADQRGRPGAQQNGQAAQSQQYDDFDVGDLGPPLDMDDNPLDANL